MNNTLGELQEKVQGKLIEPVKGKIEKKKTPNKQINLYRKVEDTIIAFIRSGVITDIDISSMLSTYT